MAEPTLEDVKELCNKQEEEEIATLECKCGVVTVEYAPRPLDLTGSGCGSGNDDPEGAEVFTTPLYARCVLQFRQGTVSPRTCAAPDVTNNFFENSCLAFVSDLQTHWEAKKQKVSAMQNSLEFAYDLVDDYVEACLVSLTKQKDFTNMLYASMPHFGVSGASRADFDSSTRTPLLNTYDEFGEGPICMSEGAVYNQLFEREKAHLDAAYAAHFKSCSPPACSFEELESVADALLKTVAVLSPLMSTVMAIAALFYSRTAHTQVNAVQ